MAPSNAASEAAFREVMLNEIIVELDFAELIPGLVKEAVATRQNNRRPTASLKLTRTQRRKFMRYHRVDDRTKVEEALWQYVGIHPELGIRSISLHSDNIFRVYDFLSIELHS